MYHLHLSWQSLDISQKCANFCTSIHFDETVMWWTFCVTTLQHRQTSVNLSLVESDGLLDHCLLCMLPVLWVRLKRQHLDWFNAWKAHMNDLNDCQTESVWGLILYYAPHENSVLFKFFTMEFVVQHTKCTYRLADDSVHSLISSRSACWWVSVWACVRAHV
jgi:hypothetical protein